MVELSKTRLTALCGDWRQCVLGWPVVHDVLRVGYPSTVCFRGSSSSIPHIVFPPELPDRARHLLQCVTGCRFQLHCKIAANFYQIKWALWPVFRGLHTGCKL